MERYFIMIVSVLVFYVLIKRNGFSKKLALAALGFVALIFGTIIVKGVFSATMIMEILPWFFMSYCIFYFIMFCLRKSGSSLKGMQEMHAKRRRFKESRKVASTNKNIKTYKGAKKKKE